MKSNTIFYNSKVNLTGYVLIAGGVFGLIIFFLVIRPSVAIDGTFNTIFNIAFTAATLVNALLGVILVARKLPGKPMVEVSDKQLSIHSYITNKWTDIVWKEIVDIDNIEQAGRNPAQIIIKTNRKNHSILSTYTDTNIDEIYDMIWQIWHSKNEN